ncbi:LLM class flavin-dependent oxidoreductase [Amycolatopsis jiangsuensis]|uniref:Alkanesulfonate monooxygenase SsuD/methylene tetrahydromethanopterin reductase-like flavin-dependent oxidoreductase (Luciferase family) n=1 Tax=Amycolatopsis jiangsuensis TaxID=1181879 RepID=A0A840J7I5_9PSEU|nr:LLM class flavin-dependent oxidoreductase [Amycolatopsis jiangsuensis]MBB4689743.1 alkanesulfonate monooxygenase SsuD/methylene tetrahydromethanopterin reductase-like flavin-dependent oxidoreductase (luciferase family) [Amycolatopsis jiangsuensis]
MSVRAKEPMMIETWNFSLFNAGTVPGEQDPTPEQLQAAYSRYLRLWVDCERFGFDGVAFAEHHFTPTGLAPSTHLLVAAVAAQTSTLRLSTLGGVLPLHDARRFAEEVGMLDYLTQGRYEPGIAPGAGSVEARKAGLSTEDIRPRYHSGADLLRKAAEDPTVTHQDQFYNLDRVTLSPRIRPGTGDKIWVTAMSPESAAWGGRRGHKVCTAFLPTPEANALAQHYRDAVTDAGRPLDPRNLGLRRRVFVAGSDSEAEEKREAAIDVFRRDVQSLEAADNRIARLHSHPDDFAVGSPKTVTERLVEQCRAGGYGSLVAFTDFALFDHADLVRSHELIGTEVAPALRAAGLAEVRG